MLIICFHRGWLIAEATRPALSAVWLTPWFHSRRPTQRWGVYLKFRQPLTSFVSFVLRCSSTCTRRLPHKDHESWQASVWTKGGMQNLQSLLYAGIKHSLKQAFKSVRLIWLFSVSEIYRHRNVSMCNIHIAERGLNRSKLYSVSRIETHSLYYLWSPPMEMIVAEGSN